MDASLANGLMFNTAVYTAGATILGVIVSFILLYMILERKKKGLIVVFVLFLIGLGTVYYAMGRKPAGPTFDLSPRTVQTEKVATGIPLPRPRPRVQKQAPLPSTGCPCNRHPRTAPLALSPQ